MRRLDYKGVQVTNNMTISEKLKLTEEEEFLVEQEVEETQGNAPNTSRDRKTDIHLRDTGKKYEGIPENDFYQFMLYKFRQDDVDFITDIFEGKDFLGPSILKAYKKDYRGELTFRELMDELYIYLKKEDWKVLSGFRGECSLVIWLRTIASNFFKQFYKRNHLYAPAVAGRRFNIESPYSTEYDLVHLIDRVSGEKEKNLLFLKYVQRIPDKETLIQMKLKDSKAFVLLHRTAIGRAERIAAQDELLSAIFFEETDEGMSTVSLSDADANSFPGAYETPEWNYNLTTEQMKKIVRDIISRWKTETYRRVIELRLIEGKSTEEAAGELGVTPGKVYNYLNIAYKRLLAEVQENKKKYYA
jgi:sigma-70, region 4